MSVLLELENIATDTIKHIYAGITPDLIKEMSITYNPWITAPLMRELEKNIDALAGYQLIHRPSANHGEIAEL